MAKRVAKDWHPEDIKAAIRKTGITLTELALRHQFSESAVRQALRTPLRRVEAVIARYLGIPPQAIWPSRYDDSGIPLRGIRAAGRNHSVSRFSAHRQKREAA